MMAVNYKAIGTAYELLCASLLKKYKIEFVKVGKTADRGIDLRGSWNLSKEYTIPVLGQCKYQSRAISSSTIRDFEGSILAETVGGQTPIGFLISNMHLSKEAKIQFKGSRISMGFIQTIEIEKDTTVNLFLLNNFAQSIASDVIISQTKNSIESGIRNEPVILYKGEKLINDA